MLAFGAATSNSLRYSSVTLRGRTNPAPFAADVESILPLIQEQGVLDHSDPTNEPDDKVASRQDIAQSLHDVEESLTQSIEDAASADDIGDLSEGNLKESATFKFYEAGSTSIDTRAQGVSLILSGVEQLRALVVNHSSGKLVTLGQDKVARTFTIPATFTGNITEDSNFSIPSVGEVGDGLIGDGKLYVIDTASRVIRTLDATTGDEISGTALINKILPANPNSLNQYNGYFYFSAGDTSSLYRLRADGLTEVELVRRYDAPIAPFVAFPNGAAYSGLGKKFRLDDDIIDEAQLESELYTRLALHPDKVLSVESVSGTEVTVLSQNYTATLIGEEKTAPIEALKSRILSGEELGTDPSAESNSLAPSKRETVRAIDDSKFFRGEWDNEITYRRNERTTEIIESFVVLWTTT